MSDSFEGLPIDLMRRIDEIAMVFERGWGQGQSPQLDEHLDRVEASASEALFCELLHIEIKARERSGEVPTAVEYIARFPQYRGQIVRVFAECVEAENASASTSQSPRSPADDMQAIGLPKIPGYDVLRIIGRGAMGVVYLAQNEKLNRRVALKMVSLTTSSQEARSRIRAEADLIARLQHPNIVQIFDVGEWEGETFLELEYVDGESLRDRLKRGPIAIRESVLLIECLARAMRYTHSHSVVHRDLKPANVLLQREGGDAKLDGDFRVADHTIKITDFGLAKFVGAEHHETQVGSILGTPNYMSPEQAAGRSVEVGPATDVYALGAMLFELLAGHPPFESVSTLELLRKITVMEATIPEHLQSSLPRDLQAVCLKCLEKDPERRYASAGELADDLRRYLENFSVRARIPTRLELFGKFVRRNQWLVGGLLAIGLALVLGSIGTLVFAFREAQQRQLADSNAQRAKVNEHAARQESYRARMALAVADVESHDVVDAARQLELAPAAFRGWEWHHLRGRLDDSTQCVVMPNDVGLSMFASSGGPRITVLSASSLKVLDEQLSQIFELPSSQFPNIRFLGQSDAGPWVLFEGNQLALSDAEGPLRSTITIPKDIATELVTAITVSRDATQVAVGGAHHPDPILQKRFFVFEPKTGRRLGPFLDHDGRITGLAFSPDGTRIVSTAEDGTARLWNPSNGLSSTLLRGHQLFVRHPAFCPDGTRFLTCSADGTVRQWDSITGTLVEPAYEGHTGGVHTARYSPDGKWIVSSGEDRTIHVWKAIGREVRAIFHGHTGEVPDVSFSSDGLRIISTSYDHSIRVWTLDRKFNPEVWSGHSSSVYPVSFAPDGQWLASGSWDHTIRLWDIPSGNLRGSLSHAGIVRTLAISSDGSVIISGCDNERELYVWDVEAMQVRKRIRGPRKSLRAVAIHPDGRTVAALDDDGSMSIVDIELGREVASVSLASPQLRGTLAYSPDGRQLAVALPDHQIGLWDTMANQITCQWPGHRGLIYSLAFDHTGKLLVSGSQDGTVRTWDVVTQKCLAEMQGHTGEVFTAIFHPDGDRVISGGRDRMVWVWDAETGGDVVRLKGHTNFVFSLAFHPLGSLLASGSGDGTIHLWKATSMSSSRVSQAESEPIANGR